MAGGDFRDARGGRHLADFQSPGRGASLAEHFINSTHPFALLIGLNGVILLAYVIAIPANEIVIPTILMLTVLSTGMAGMGEGAGVMFELESEMATARVFQAGGGPCLRRSI